ncbi:MAG TPA: hypothetical protein VKG67_04975 [Gallionellaceae bacterium]|nr:hypothetical protein [Gallionellaceae bacterium]
MQRNAVGLNGAGWAMRLAARADGRAHVHECLGVGGDVISP